MRVLFYIILGLSLVNIFRLALFMIGADIYEVRRLLRQRAIRRTYQTNRVDNPDFDEIRTAAVKRSLILTTNQNLDPRRRYNILYTAAAATGSLVLLRHAEDAAAELLDYDFRKRALQNLHVLRQALTSKHDILYSDIPYQPMVSIIIPAHNEELCIVNTVQSVLANDYKHKQIIVVDDGSEDATLTRLHAFKQKGHIKDLIVVHQNNQGKASAINNALQNHTNGELIMVLDADSLLDPRAISRIVEHFKDSEVVAAAANVKVLPGHGILNLAQRLEYVISYRLKRALTTMSMEYIIGGVGSTFRKSIIEACDYYDTDTLTEDIDFTMKIINQKGNRHHHIVFAADVLAYTEGVLTFRGLLKQRFRWKYGRLQAFVKNRNIFFSSDKKHTKRLTWGYLPFVIFSELELFFDPLFTMVVLYASIAYDGWRGLLGIYLFVTLFALVNVLFEPTETSDQKMELLMMTPFAYPLLLITSTVDYLVLLKALAKLPDIFLGRNQVSHWRHVERSGVSSNVNLS